MNYAQARAAICEWVTVPNGWGPDNDPQYTTAGLAYSPTDKCAVVVYQKGYYRIWRPQYADQAQMLHHLYSRTPGHMTHVWPGADMPEWATEATS